MDAGGERQVRGGEAQQAEACVTLPLGTASTQRVTAGRLPAVLSDSLLTPRTVTMCGAGAAPCPVSRSEARAAAARAADGDEQWNRLPACSA